MITDQTATEQVVQAVVVPAEQEDDAPKGKKIDLPAYVPTFKLPQEVDLQLVDTNKEGIAQLKEAAELLQVASKKDRTAANRMKIDKFDYTKRVVVQRVEEVVDIHKEQIKKIKNYGNELLTLIAEGRSVVTSKIDQYDKEVAEREEALRKRADDRALALKNIGFVWVGRNESYVLSLPATSYLPAFSEVMLMEDVKQLDDEAFDRIWIPAHQAYQAVELFNQQEQARLLHEQEQADQRRQAELAELEELRAYKAAQTKTQQPPAPVEQPTSPVVPPIVDPVVPQPYQRVATVPARQVDPVEVKAEPAAPPVDEALAAEITRVLDELDPIYDLSADPGMLVAQHPGLAKLVHQLRIDVSELLLRFRNQAFALNQSTAV